MEFLEYRDPGHAPSLLLRMVEAGQLGKMSAKGFYAY
jgi:3-hydroxyacyl-CoA dehydrogenase